MKYYGFIERFLGGLVAIAFILVGFIGSIVKTVFGFLLPPLEAVYETVRYIIFGGETKGEKMKIKRIEVTCKRCGNARDHYYQEVEICNGVYEMTIEPCENCLEDTYNNGNKDGYEDGYSDGQKDGHKEGYDDGNKNGYADGYSDGYTKGYSDGRKDGHTEGYEDGHKDGYKEGYDDGEME